MNKSVLLYTLPIFFARFGSGYISYIMITTCPSISDGSEGCLLFRLKVLSELTNLYEKALLFIYEQSKNGSATFLNKKFSTECT